ncbi:F-box protein SKIP8 [Linum perenne]
MEIIDFSSQTFLIASSFTLLSLLLTVLSIRRLKSPNKSRSSSFRCRTCNSGCFSDGTVENSVNRGGEAAAEMVVAAREGTGMERQCGASMMEQLVPEITTHALSYLDYPSLCRLSMTNSLMRKAANDDNAWKALYHKLVQYNGAVTIRPCEYVYADCVNNVITYLRDKTPYTKSEAFTTYYPADTSAGYVAGFAACVDGTSFTDCQNCLYAAKDWLDQNCPAAAVGSYFGGFAA